MKSCTVRLTNFYNLMVGSEVPGCGINFFQSLYCFLWYVVQRITNWAITQPAIINRIKERPKHDKLREVAKFRITRSTKVPGLRRVRSTMPWSYHLSSGRQDVRSFCTSSATYGKGLSLITSVQEDLLSGNYDSTELRILLVDLTKNNRKANNLSKILSDPNFLIACWARIRSKRGALTKSFSAETLDGININWFKKQQIHFAMGPLISNQREVHLLKDQVVS